MNTVNSPLLSPNGNPSKLTPEQWELVRTLEFKEWFGDWEKEYRIEKLQKSKPIEIMGEEYKGKYELNQNSAQKYILDNFRNEYVNTDTGDKIEISRIGAKKVTSHDADNAVHLQSISAISQIIEKSIFITEDLNLKDNGKYNSYKYYVAGINIGGVDYTVRLTIGVKNGVMYYDHGLTEIEKGTLLDSLKRTQKPVAKKKSSDNGFTTTGDAPIPSYADYKDKRLFSILQTNITKTLDINAEPKKEDIAEYITKLNSNKTKVMKTKDEQYQADLAAVKKNSFALDFVKEQTPEICLAAVRQDGLTLKFINEQTPELCMEAVKQNGYALEYVKVQTPEICLEAVKQKGWALEDVKEQTPEICFEAVKQNGWALEDVKEQTPEICFEAVKQKGWALEDVKEQTPEICFEAVKQNGRALKYVKEQTPELCMEAVKQNGWALKYVSPEFQPLFAPLIIGDRKLSLEERYALRTAKTLELKDVLDKKGRKRDVVVKMDKEGKIKIYPPISISQKQENKQKTKNGIKI